MNYPKHDAYAKIYARYLVKPPVQFTKHIDMLPPDSHVLDLCGGGGRLTMYAHDKDMTVDYVDQEQDMIPIEVFEQHTRINVYSMPMSQFLPRAFPHLMRRYDLVMCRQAITYWVRNTDMGLLANLMKPGGKFIFNTFANKPPETPTVKQYVIDGRMYVEVYYSIGNTIHHAQICEGYPVHTTSFGWVSSDDFTRILSPYFDIQLDVKGASSFYVCTRKP